VAPIFPGSRKRGRNRLQQHVQRENAGWLMEQWDQLESRKKRFVLKHDGIRVSCSLFLNRFPDENTSFPSSA
jgi:hypothetical protein